jgi:catechol 2,3-dioxygenase-like lactoylglutathione lyase family enzyme
MASLCLVVLRCRDLERSRAFYAALGLELVREQHEGGPVHHAVVLEGGVVLELYPSSERAMPSSVRLGLRVSDVEAAAQAVSKLFPASVSSRSVQRAIVVDPDGNTVELTR